MHTFGVNGRQVWIYRMADLGIEDQADIKTLILRRAKDVAERGGWGVEMPPNAPKRAICKCGAVYAQDHLRKCCYKCE